MSAWMQTMGWMLTCSLVFMGVGALAQRLLRARAGGDPWRSFWWGIIVTMPLTSLWHLFAPLDEMAAAVLAFFGAVGLWLERWPLLRHARGYLVRRRAAVAMWLAVWAFVPWLSLQPLTCVDAGYYYVAGVEWHRAFAVVPGLQATNPLSVFNTGAFLLMALVNTGPFAHEGHLVFNAMLAWWGLPVLADALHSLTHRWSLHAIVGSLAPLPALDAFFTDRMSCPSADIGVLWLGLASVVLALHARRHGGVALLPLLLLPLFKLSMISLALALLLLVRWRGLVKPVALAALAWVPFLVTNVVVSGYLLYPAPVLRFEVDWALPHRLVEQVNAIISGYARHDGIVGSDDAWMPLWRLMLMNRAVLMPSLLVVGSVVIALARRARSWWPLASCVIGALIWYRLAPDPRFAGVLLWFCAAVALATALGVSPGGWVRPELASRIALLLVVVGLLAGDLPFTTLRSMPTGRPTLPDNHADERTTLEDGTLLLDCTPGRLDFKGPACWSVPCAALFPPGLRLRTPGDFSKGFKLPESAQLADELVH